MKKFISILLCMGIIIGMFSVMSFADDAEINSVDRIDITIIDSEVYCDIPAYKCFLRTELSPRYIGYSISLEKEQGGKWSRDIYNEESIGTGNFRWRFYLSEYYYPEEKETRIVPGTTQVFIDGAECGTVDNNFSAYSEPFEITEDDKCPEPIVIDEIKIEGFKEPTVGEAVCPDGMKAVCPGLEDHKLWWSYSIREYDTKGNTNEFLEVFQKNRSYVYYFQFFVESNKYVFADSVKLIMGEDEFEMNVEESKRYAKLRISYVIPKHTGFIAETESEMILLLSYFNLLSNRFSSFKNSFWSDIFASFFEKLRDAFYSYYYDIEYYAGMDFIDADYFLYIEK